MMMPYAVQRSVTHVQAECERGCSLRDVLHNNCTTIKNASSFQLKGRLVTERPALTIQG